VKPNQLSAWRCLAKQRKLVPPAVGIATEPTTFAPLVLCDPEPPQAPEPLPQPSGKLRLIVGDVAIDLAAGTSAVRIGGGEWGFVCCQSEITLENLKVSQEIPLSLKGYKNGVTTPLALPA
jgi:hypothetical protein